MHPDPSGTIRGMYGGTLDTSAQIQAFRRIDRVFPARVVRAGGEVAPLRRSSTQITQIEFVSAGARVSLADYIALNRVTGLLILKEGRIAYEGYRMGNDERTRWMTMSVAKTITSSLVGAALHERYIDSLDDPVTKYVAELAGSAYDAVNLRCLLQMASGVRWDETYTDPRSDRRRLLEAQLTQRPGAMLKLMAALPRAAPPGTVWNYSTGETFVAGAVVRAAVGRPLAEYLSDRIWAKAGMEADASWCLESPGGLETGGSGFSATLRDYGRYGLFLMNEGATASGMILPAGWVGEAGSAQRVGGRIVGYGFFTWPVAAAARLDGVGEFQAYGIFGQHLYVNLTQRVVIVVWSALPQPSGPAPVADRDFFAAVTAALAVSG